MQKRRKLITGKYVTQYCACVRQWIIGRYDLNHAIGRATKIYTGECPKCYRFPWVIGKDVAKVEEAIELFDSDAK